MNIEYTYMDGKVIIRDENGKNTQREYYDNLDKVLAQENLIETMEKRIQELERKSASYRKYNEKLHIPIFPIFPISVMVSIPFVSKWFTDDIFFAQSIDTVLGPMSKAMVASISISLFTIPLYAGVTFITCSESIKNEQGINSELSFLSTQVEKEREVLETLQLDKSRDNESTEFRTVKVNDLEQLKRLKEYLNFYFDLGYNVKKYYKYYQQGRLDRNLPKNYGDTELQVAKQYMEEKGPSLTFKKKKNNTNNS